jgi:hypothetical protein
VSVVARYEPREARTFEAPPWVALMAATAELAAQIADTDFVPASLRRNAAAITACILYGAEVGLGPMQSLAKVHVIDGRPAIAAETQRALVVSKGHEVWIDELTVTKATVAIRRAGQDTVHRFTWSADDSRRAGLDGRPNYKRYPREMNLARASALAVRAVCPDVIGGLAAVEEIDGDPDIAARVEGPAGTERAPTNATRSRQRRQTLVAAPPPPPPGPSVDDERPPLPHELADEAPLEMMSRPQQGKLFALLGERGIGKDRAGRLAWASAVLGRPLESAKDLTRAEAAQLIDVLEQTPAPSVAAAAAGSVQDAPADPPEASAGADREQAAAFQADLDAENTEQLGLAGEDARAVMMQAALDALGAPDRNDLKNLILDAKLASRFEDVTGAFIAEAFADLEPTPRALLYLRNRLADDVMP